MSGHSHWSSIKHQKESADAKRGKVFSKMAKMIAVAAKEGGGDPEGNSKLRLIIEMARKVNMPKDNIERAIKKGTGELEGEILEEVFFEAYGPGGIAVVIKGITDNKNRTLGELKKILTQNNGKLASEGSVKWLFEIKGCITIDSESQISDFQNKENLELLVIESGADDISWRDGLLNIYTKAGDLEQVKKALEGKEIKIDSASLDWVAKEAVLLEEKEKTAAQKLFEALDENEGVQEIYSNLKN